ncbi:MULTISPECIES: DUF4105 domain-containing protein [Stenotrophomonas]|uniref:DUF4105 domain-containing protein n=1 Tax=Stenotrophomonas nitritireducens TaxID=83617 RepID=A0ABR5NH30_9GAMM|nr:MULTISPECIES: DUF4105 domain-containing protein [Stenotrophomonas]KQO02688.1 hypothetical protein ASF01_02980 [Stenotrophomonas sp. Leaf70]KRG55373.1 hypothetical protein ABB22_14550 [Stenotrophomonas nitritireducens]
MSAACRRWRRRCWTLLLCAAIAAPVQAALRIEVAADGLSAQELQASRQLIEQVLVRLPTPVRDGQALALRLRWRDDLPSHVAGRARGSELGLDQRLLAALPGDGADASTPAWRRAQAALIHELAHALDRSVAGGWSHDARFLDLAGWQVRPLLPGRGRNRFLLRSPDRYELHSPAEFFAVNLEHYLLDADNACRRPALHRWFAAALGPLPAAAEATCASALPFVEAGAQDGMAGLLELDPARVYEVDYLLAEGNGQPMSRWGHSMLRLVVCAPGRAPGPACRMDLQYHRVLSFRAFVGDVQLSNWRGLTGSYPSRLFVLPLDRVVEDYTRVELRGLSSVPLRLRREEIAALLEQAARVHWTYDGRYYFVSNNCAVETWKLLHDGVPRLAGRRLSSITPVGLLRRLERGGDAVPVSPGDRAAAVRAGYYFESDAPRYRQLFEVVHAGLQPPVADVERWLELPPGERRRWMDADDERVLAALLVLEQAAWRRGELRVRDLLKRSLLARGGDAAALERVRGLLAQAGLLLAPGMLAGEGYGLPLERERAVLRRDVAGRTQAAGDERRSLDAALRDLLPEAERARLLGVESNLDHLRQRLRLRYVSGTEAAGVDPVPRP